MTVASSSSTPVPPIRFGTDGWRAVIADEFTFDRVRQVSRASARVLAETYPGEGVVVGYDNRFLSEHFAKAAAEAIAAEGIAVKLSTCAAPTPAFSWVAHCLGLHGALVITASHNPPDYSGIKLKGGFGGSVPADITQKVEQLLLEMPVEDYGQAPSSSEIAVEEFDPWPLYLKQLSAQVDLEAIRNSSAKVWIDAMHGSAAGGMTQLLGDRIEEVRGYRDPLFGGLSPEPLPPQLAGTMAMIASDDAPLKVGLVFDGDGDRIAAIDGEGKFLSPQILVPVLLEHCAKRRGYSGELVKTVSGSELFDRVAALFNIPVSETPIGFKYIADRMLETNVLVGGEESGGIGYTGHIPERDGMLSALYLLEAIAATGLDLSELYRQLQERTGYTSFYNRRDLHLSDKSKQERVMASLASAPPSAIEGRAVSQHLTKDGHKFLLKDGSWLLIRASGTEPVLRLYCEALSPEAVEELLDWAQTLANNG